MADRYDVLDNEHAVASRNGFPVTEGHSLVIPRRHVPDCFELRHEEFAACRDLLHLLRNGILESDPSVEGFNIGVNAGAVAGQTISNATSIWIRRRGDVAEPARRRASRHSGQGWLLTP